MTNKNPLSRFWQELKHRKVLRSLAIYAGTAFIILEASSIIFPIWNLPEWSIRLVLWILILGGFVNVIIAWFYDITPEGMQRTKPMEELASETRTQDSRGWKAATYISLVVIVGLIMFNLLGSKGTVRAGEIQSMVILPFGNLTGDDQLDYLVSSMHSMLITDLGRIGALRVRGKTTSDKYIGSGMSASEISKEQNVEAVMETDVMCLGTDSVCIVFRLLSTLKEEEQLWMYEYREHKSQFLNMYNKVTRKVAEEAMIELSPDEERLLARSRTIRRETFDNYLMGHYYLGDASKDALYKAKDYLNRAIETDPDWAPLYAGLTSVWLSIAQVGYESPQVSVPEIFKNLSKALELDPDLADIHRISGMMAYLTEWNCEKAEDEFRKALDLNPSDAVARVLYGQFLGIQQRFDDARMQGKIAIELDPLQPMVRMWYSALLLEVGDNKEGLAEVEELLADHPEHYLAHAVLELASYLCGEYDKTLAATKVLMSLEGEAEEAIDKLYREKGFEAVYLELARQTEEEREEAHIAPIDIVIKYMMAGEHEKALEWLEKGYEAHDPNMVYIGTPGYLCEPLFDHPRFIAILDKMNLPYPKTE
jgi:serine/threonine-protein kinase